MSSAQLSDLMELERLDTNLYRGISWDLGFRALFGGQVLGQSLVAATATVAKNRHCHSYHSYFLLPGDARQPVIYEVENVRDGGSFSTRRVKAIQNGKNIFYMTASFQATEHNLQHQFADMPNVPEPLDNISDLEFYQQNPNLVGKGVRNAMNLHGAIELRSVNNLNPFSKKTREPKKQVWMRSSNQLSFCPTLHQAVLAYASDFHFLGTALLAHGIAVSDPSLRIATIDHAIWFHQPIDMNDWHLYAMESPKSGNARALVNGKIYNQNGELVASTAQEGLMRFIQDND